MAAVKGSKQYRVKVVEDHPGRRILVSIVAAALVTGAVIFSFQIGSRSGADSHAEALANVSRLADVLAEKNQLLEDLEQRLTNIQLGAKVDRQANEDVRQEVIELRKKIAALEEDNSFYRNLMAPTDNQRGLNIGAVELSNTNNPREYRYKVVMQQLVSNHTLLKGELNFDVIGRENGLPKTYSLSDLSKQVAAKNIKLRFKYFQTLQGEMTLPEGFEPQRIALEARSFGKKSTVVEKRFGWLVQET